MNKLLGFATKLMGMAIAISLILLFVGVGVVILIYVCIARRAFRRGLGNSSLVGRGGFGTTSMSQNDLEKLPCFDFIANSRGSSPVDCAVCLENFRVGDKCKLLPLCKHSFHAECLDSWLLRTPSCPICRTTADSWKGDSVSDGESSCSSEIAIELREHQSTDSGQNVMELREGQTAESGHLNDLGTELRQSQTIESTHLGDIETEPRENQTALDVALSEHGDNAPLHRGGEHEWKLKARRSSRRELTRQGHGWAVWP
ncbi:unnamed protein product [Ilex paraguariensis]|uniref:RING-type domain-containing protein n=1 Tax=Ilex paraguariensis TaxID=185542 RepID=A0ABC8STD1_9AQUA